MFTLPSVLDLITMPEYKCYVHVSLDNGLSHANFHHMQFAAASCTIMKHSRVVNFAYRGKKSAASPPTLSNRV